MPSMQKLWTKIIYQSYMFIRFLMICQAYTSRDTGHLTKSRVSNPQSSVNQKSLTWGDGCWLLMVDKYMIYITTMSSVLQRKNLPVNKGKINRKVWCHADKDQWNVILNSWILIVLTHDKTCRTLGWSTGFTKI